MKKKIRRRKCKNCDDLFKPDPRNLKRQKFCRKPECKEASKEYSQLKWLMKPKNKGYFSGPPNVTRVQQWREQNPGSWKRKKSKKTTSLIEGALQETLSLKTIAGKGFSSDLMQNALQDIIDFTDQETVKLVPDVLKKLIDQKKEAQYGQILFFPGTL
jgi:hypothetical protein